MIVRDSIGIKDPSTNVGVSTNELTVSDANTGSKKLSELGGTSSFFRNFTYNEDIIKGKFVSMLGSGNIESSGIKTLQTAIPSGASTESYTSAVSSMSVSFDPFNRNKFAITYEGFVSGQYTYAAVVIGTIQLDGGVIFGPENILMTTYVGNVMGVYDPLVRDRIFISYLKGITSYGYTMTCTIEDTKVIAGAELVYLSDSTYGPVIVADPFVTGRYLICYRNINAYGTVTAFSAGTSGTTVTKGTAVAFTSASISAPLIMFDKYTQDRFIVSYAASNVGTMRVGTVTGTSITYGLVGTASASATQMIRSCSFTSQNSVLVMYKQGTSLSYRIATVTGTTLSFGTESLITTMDTNGTFATQIDLMTNSSVILVHSSATAVYSMVGTISGNTITFGGSTLAVASGGCVIDQDPYYQCRFMIGYNDLSNSSIATVVLGQMTTTVSNVWPRSVVGVSTITSTTGTSCKVQLSGSCSEFSSLSPGLKYYLNQDGTITTSVTDVRVGIAISATEMLLTI